MSKKADRRADNSADALARDFVHGNFVWTPAKEQWLKADYQQRRSMIHGIFTLKSWRDEFYNYDGATYRHISDTEMRRYIVRFLLACNEDSDTQDQINISTHLVNNVMLCIAAMRGVHIPERQQPYSLLEEGLVREERTRRNGFVFDNGHLLISDSLGEPVLIGHSPQYFALNKAGYRYDPEATCPKWSAFLEDVMESDQDRIRLLRQWAGYLVAGRVDLHRFMLIAGEGRNGKTVFTTMLEKMLGADDVTHIPLQQFSSQFALASTLGKLLNSTSESTHTIDETAETVLKSYTSGDRMTFQRKYKDPIHDRPTARIMVSTNQLPQFRDKSHGIWRRMLFVPFDKCYETDQQNPNLVRELSGELPGIFNWALEGMHDLAMEGRFIEPARCREALEQYRRDTNPARSFLLENFTQSLGLDGMEAAETYRLYRDWCEQNSYRPMNNAGFGKEVMRTFDHVSRERIRTDGRRMWIYRGLTRALD